MAPPASIKVIHENQIVTRRHLFRVYEYLESGIDGHARKVLVKHIPALLDWRIRDPCPSTDEIHGVFICIKYNKNKVMRDFYDVLLNRLLTAEANATGESSCKKCPPLSVSCGMFLGARHPLLEMFFTATHNGVLCY